MIGDLDTHDVGRAASSPIEGELIGDLRRLSPGARAQIPGRAEDAIAATQMGRGQCRSSSASTPRKSIVGGDSAGGNLAAVAAIAAARQRTQGSRARLLIYPSTDFRMNHPSHSEPETSDPADAFRDQMVHRSLYGRRRSSTTGAPRPSAPKLEGLPPAYVLVAGADPLRDEGNEYAERLKAAGVPVTYRYFPGQFHGFFTMGKLLNQANVAASEIGAWLKVQG